MNLIPVTQRGSTCWLACIATLLECQLEDLPTFEGEGCMPIYGRHGLAELGVWLAERNLFLHDTKLWRRTSDELIAVPPGYAILNLRVTANGYEQHSIVTFNGLPVWDPHPKSPSLLPPDWNGIIQGRSWQVAEPVGWTTFGILDPSKAAGIAAAPLKDTPSMKAIGERAHWLLNEFLGRARIRPKRPGVDYGACMDLAPHILGAYCDQATEYDGRKALHRALDETQEMVLAFEELRLRNALAG